MPPRQPSLLLTLLAASTSLLTSAQSFVGGGDLGSQAPFSLPPSTFSSLTSNANSNNRFPITGYDITVPGSASDATAHTINGWNLDVHLTNDVPLSKSADSSLDRNGYFQATKLSLVPPKGNMAAYDEKDWRVCGIVFTGGLKGQGDLQSGVVGNDGSCKGIVSDQCIQQLQVDSVAVRNGSTDDTEGARNGGCEALVLPSVCQDDFAGHGGGSAYEIKPVTGSDNTGRLSFFAAGSTPTPHRNDQAAIAAAQRNVWPVLLTWTHFGKGSSDGQQQGDAHDSAGWLSCVQAPNSTTQAQVGGEDGGKENGAPAGYGKGFSSMLVRVVAVGLGVVGLAAVL